SLFLEGQSGAGKTELATLCQQHYGTWEARRLPGSWLSTGNALGELTFLAKDTLLVIDDFAPDGPATDIARSHREAGRIFRAQGNNASRKRLRSDTTFRPNKPPRGLILSTGEDVPRGKSVRARLLILGMHEGDLDWSRLTACQQDAATGKYA